MQRVADPRLSTIVDALPGMVAYWDAQLICRYANRSYQTWFGKAPATVIGTPMHELLGPDTFARNEPYIRGALGGEPQSFERTLTKADGSVGHTLANYVPDIDEHGIVAGFFVLVSDVTSIKAAEAQLELANTIFETTDNGILVTDADNVIAAVNAGFTKITGYAAADVLGRSKSMFAATRDAEAAMAERRRLLVADGRWQGEVWYRRKDGEIVLVWQTTTVIGCASGRPDRFVSILSDITEAWRTNERIRHLAFYDALTDLPNRSLLYDRLANVIGLAERERQLLAVLFIDLDGFKGVNDVHGHEVGDQLLTIVAHRLRDAVRRSDTVARYGGDEFVVLLIDSGTERDAGGVAANIIAAINEPVDFAGTEIRVGASVGIAFHPVHGRTPEALIGCADEAMYASKKAGRNSFRVSST